MANLSSLGYKSITTMPFDEGVQLILSIRENRRKVKVKTTSTKTTKVKKIKSPDLTPDQAARLLEMLTNKIGEQND